MLIKNKSIKLFLIGIGAIFLISACGKGGVDTVPVEDAAVPESSEIEIGELPTALDNASDDGNAPTLGFALGDPNLHATGRGTVSLASGEIQLLEFFAFW